MGYRVEEDITRPATLNGAFYRDWRGVRSRLYQGGRYSPTRERGVHHFHRLLCEFLE